MRLSDDSTVAFLAGTYTRASARPSGVKPPGSILCRVVEFELAVGLSRGDGWGARRQTDAGQIALDGARLGEGGDDLHGSPAGGTDGDIDLENAGEECGP